MTGIDYKEEYLRWLKNASEYISELKVMSNADIEDAFYKELEFGTGGLRGILGAGTNRMNIYTVAKASQGLANYVKAQNSINPKIAIAYDSRIMSKEFSEIASDIFSANGIEVYIYPELMPTPCLSFAVRYYHCDAGIVITASHNPAKYNGYKVYGSDGCQITTEAADAIQHEIETVDIFSDIVSDRNQQLIHIITDECFDNYIECVKAQSVLFGDEADKSFKIVYTPLNGTGLKPVTRILKESGFEDVFVVPEQMNPDGNFPTCPYPNPEIKEALDLGIKYAKELNADLVLATDPDADRVGIAIKDGEQYKLLTGNEVGLLLLQFICEQRTKHGKMPKNPVFIKTIVTTDLAEKIADSYGVKTINVLTGFKFIGEQIGLLEQQNHSDSFILGFEESYGYLSGDYVRDKDSINAVLLICEIIACYRLCNISPNEQITSIYKQYGHCINKLYAYEFDGTACMSRIERIMNFIRSNSEKLEGHTIVQFIDYQNGAMGLPKSNVIKLVLDEDISIVVRPSGTEPKIKFYICIHENKVDSILVEQLLNKLILK